jgi:hypothetical protein
MSKVEQKACLSTSSSFSPSKPLPHHRLQGATSPAQEDESKRNSSAKIGHRVPKGKKDEFLLSSPRPSALLQRAHSAPSKVQTSGVAQQQMPRRPDYVLTCCFVLLYLELAWLIVVLLRSYHSRY